MRATCDEIPRNKTLIEAEISLFLPKNKVSGIWADKRKKKKNYSSYISIFIYLNARQIGTRLLGRLYKHLGKPVPPSSLRFFASKRVMKFGISSVSIHRTAQKKKRTPIFFRESNANCRQTGNPRGIIKSLRRNDARPAYVTEISAVRTYVTCVARKIKATDRGTYRRLTVK